MKKLTHNKIGIWGCGATGKSIAHFLRSIGCTDIGIYDDNKNVLPPDVHHQTITHIQNKNIFFQSYDYIIPSPGIDITPYKKDMPPIITECDIFFAYWKKPVIAITGTLGKTTVTNYITQLLNNAGYHAAAGGNIGTPMLSLLEQQAMIDMAVLELSSFQLAYTKTCIPDLAIITNIYPNHLDWHKTTQDYTQAKLRICSQQKSDKKALIPQSITHQIATQADVSTFVDARNTNQDAYYIVDNTLWHGATKKDALLDIAGKTHQENRCIALAALDILDIPIVERDYKANKHTQHRVEYVTTVAGIAVYNDSKSTIIQATIAATYMFSDRPTTLILGGTSKGVNRSSQIPYIPDHVTHIVCFGAEAAHLARACKENGFVTSIANTLHKAIQLGLQHTKPNGILLFSPGGASFDLFTNYKERGKNFTSTVRLYSTTHPSPGANELSQH